MKAPCPVGSVRAAGVWQRCRQRWARVGGMLRRGRRAAGAERGVKDGRARDALQGGGGARSGAGRSRPRPLECVPPVPLSGRIQPGWCRASGFSAAAKPGHI